MTKLLCFVLNICICCFLSSCSKKDDLSEIDRELIKIYKLIDENRSVEAVGYVDFLLEKEDKTEIIYSLKMAQSSAYAKLAGFNFKKLTHVSAALIELVNTQKSLKENKETLFDIEEEKIEIEKLDDSAERRRRYEKTADRILEQRAAVFSNNIDLYAAYVKILMGMPSLKKKDIVFLEQAISILEGYGKQILPEDAIFRALLKALKGRRTFTSELFKQKDSETCSMGLTSIYSSLMGSREGLDSILVDLAIARPSLEGDIKSLRIELRNGFEALTVFKSLTNLLRDLTRDRFSFFSYNIDEIFKFNCSSF